MARLSMVVLKCFVLLVLSTAAASVRAQEPDLNPQRGFMPGASYSLGEIETINMTGGNLNVNIPFTTLPPGRAGHTFGFQYNYNSKIWNARRISGAPPGYNWTRLIGRDDGGWQFGWSFSLQLQLRESLPPSQCDSEQSQKKYKLRLITPDGSEHILHPVNPATNQPYDDYQGDSFYRVRPDGYVQGSCAAGTPVTTTLTYHTKDSTYWRVDIEHDTHGVNDPWTDNPWMLYKPDGSRFRWEPSVEKVYDANGNFVERKQTFYDNRLLMTLVDEFDRKIALENIGGVDYIRTIEAGGVHEMAWSILYQTINVTKTYHMDDQPTPATINKNFLVPSQVVLPTQAGSGSYAFTYSDSANGQGWGELKSITLPSGASANYVWKRDGQNNLLWKDVLDNHPTSKAVKFLEEYDGADPPPLRTETWTYDIGDTASTMTAPDGGKTCHSYFSASCNEPSCKPGMVWKTEYPDRRVVERWWTENRPIGGSIAPSNNPIAVAEFVSFRSTAMCPSAPADLVKTSAKWSNIDKNGNFVIHREYDWTGPSVIGRAASGEPNNFTQSQNPTRVTWTWHYNQTPDSSEMDLDDADAYHKSTSPHRKNAKEWEELRLADNTVLSRTEFTYDYPATSGNVTLERKWDSTQGPSTNVNNYITVSHGYVSGNRIWTLDARGYQTDYLYGGVPGCSPDPCTNLYPTRIRRAVGQTVQQTTEFKYDYWSGKVTESKDSDNTIITTTAYDPFGRPTLVKEAQGTSIERQTLTSYSDTLRRVITRTDLDTPTADRLKLVTIQRYDQLGRIRLRQQIEDKDSECPTDANCPETVGIKVQTRYRSDTSGNYTLVSNPFRATISSGAGTETTMGWTRAVSEAAGSSQVQTFSGTALPYPWGSSSSTTGVVFTTHDLNTTTVLDQANKTRKSEVDGLGRLTAVTEGPTGSAYTTTYEYDELDNLEKVIQGVQTRSFIYSSLSRLLRATNPESLTVECSVGIPASAASVCYSHDANGNVTLKKDARSIETAITYDALNRVTARNYTGDTPDVSYCYDGSTAGTACTSAPSGAMCNLKGKLTRVTSSASQYDYTCYDKLANVTSATQTTAGAGYGMSFTYNLAGGLKTVNYPSGRVVSPTYDLAGRLSTIGGTPSYASGMLYAAHNALREITLGNTLVQTASYSNRLQPREIGLGIASGNPNLFKLEYCYTALDTEAACPITAAGNNGNLIIQKIIAPGTPAMSQTQTYAYL